MANQSSIAAGMNQSFLGEPVEICIVTGNLRTTLDGLLLLGIGPFKICKFTPQNVKNQTFRGQPAEFAIDVAFATQGRMVWEVMQPVSGLTLMREYLESTHGKGGIQHISVDCAKGQEKDAGPLVGAKAHEEALRRRQEFEQRGEQAFSPSAGLG